MKSVRAYSTYFNKFRENLGELNLILINHSENLKLFNFFLIFDIFNLLVESFKSQLLKHNMCLLLFDIFRFISDFVEIRHSTGDLRGSSGDLGLDCCYCGEI